MTESITLSPQILAHIFGLIGLSIGLLAWQMHLTKHIIFNNMVSCLFWAAHFWSIGAPIGMIMNLYNVPKDVLLLKTEEQHAKKIICSFLIFATLTALFNLEKAIDLLPIFACFLTNIPLIWNANRNLIARGCFVGNSFWLFYCLANLSVFGTIASALTMLSALIGMARHEKWEIGRCYRSFLPSLGRALFIKPKTYPWGILTLLLFSPPSQQYGRRCLGRLGGSGVLCRRRYKFGDCLVRHLSSRYRSSTPPLDH